MFRYAQYNRKAGRSILVYLWTSITLISKVHISRSHRERISAANIILLEFLGSEALTWQQCVLVLPRRQTKRGIMIHNFGLKV